ncbi:hypothetical protein [Vibrio alginolyticus]|uniref:hypothetical protein n=1 Tax=Vibrio alginolyticus TaxID=663 RepID=UPI0022AA6522|nr:hypothetical protein [Vibrio alginolyticus]MCZ2802005.1 hypothetical protein [Vibrio alginolyticus]
MTEKNDKKSLGMSLLLFFRGMFFNTLVYMFLKKGWKQHLVGFLVLGGVILTVGIGSFLVATNIMGWDYHSALSPMYRHAANLLIGFMNLSKLSFLLGVFIVGLVVNTSSSYCAKYQNKREDRFATALELEISTSAALTFVNNAISTVLVAIFWTGVMLVIYSEFVEAIAGLNEIKESMLYCLFGYLVLNLILTHGLSDDIQKVRKQWERRPVRAKVSQRTRCKTAQEQKN